jgi:hypothetical protein
MKSLCFALLLALSATPACSHYSTPKRQERAYARYIKKLRAQRDRRLARLHHDEAKHKAQAPVLSEPEPRETTQVSEAPATVPSDSGNQ